MHFKQAFNHVLNVEGTHYTNHPMDKGGPTKFGITLSRLRLWRNNKRLGPASVKTLSRDEAAEIYKSMYWDRWRLDEVKSERIALVMFDQCVNWGPGKRTSKRVQKSLNKMGIKKLVVDGDIGPKTLRALNSVNDKAFVLSYMFDAQDYYCDLVYRKRTQIVFLKGWINRTQIAILEALQ